MSLLPGNLTPPHPCPHTQALVCSLQERASGILLCHSPTTGQHSWKWVAQILAGYLKKDGVSQADSILCWFAHGPAEHPLGSSGKSASGRREKACPDEEANEQAYSSQAEATQNHPWPQPVEGVPSLAARLYHGARGPDSFRFSGLGPAARITCACIGNRNSGKVIGWGPGEQEPLWAFLRCLVPWGLGWFILASCLMGSEANFWELEAPVWFILPWVCHM